jgi:hypothetical protein
MHSHRFRNQTGIWHLPRAQEPQASAKGFMLCPMALVQTHLGEQNVWQRVYLLAFQQAQAVVRPSLLERDLLANWN